MRFSEGFVTVCNTEQTILLLWLIKEMNSWILGITLDIPVSSEQKQTNTEVCNPIYSQTSFFSIITFKESIFRQPDGKSYEVIMQYRQLLFCGSKGKS
ncbi:uncharacterized protein [Canis lupus baileyi]|uniref:uncharacterized protein LOC111093154 isoform X19 n=1 Tax=Canis lupus familiaris TaxID=9615 RepID=UPI0018F6825C|nr:uncharacterized protein LOC111093154 isoform X19 [Canis lupus familiaris]